jgi:hypothetical protein
MSEQVDLSNEVKEEVVEQTKKSKSYAKHTKSKPMCESPKEVIMTWGKYKQKTVKEIIDFDEKYAKWVYRQDFVKKFEDIYRVLHEHFQE